MAMAWAILQGGSIKRAPALPDKAITKHIQKTSKARMTGF
jgi:hypothetical protein